MQNRETQMKKIFSNKLDELKKKEPPSADVEKKLIPRLKFMGYVMYSLSLASMLFAMINLEEKEQGGQTVSLEAVTGFQLLMEEEEREPTPKEVLNFYFVGGIFALVGVSCFLIARRKNKVLNQDPQNSV